MTCPQCPGEVPVISQALAAHTVVGMTAKKRQMVAQRSMEWLTTRHDGLTLYEGICGRQYTREERTMIAIETPIVAALPCPFHDPTAHGKCKIGGLGSRFNEKDEQNKAPYGWAPTMFIRLIDPEGFRSLVRTKAIADAKVSMLTRNTALT